MAQFPALQSSYAAGEVTPALRARVDLAKYRVGLQQQRNMFSVVHGGSINRAGTAFVDPVGKPLATGRLVEFKYSTTDTYCLEFGNVFMRVIRNGAYVLNATKVITAISQANPGVITSAAHGYSSGDRVFVDAVVGMTRVNGRSFTVAVVDANHFSIGVDTSGYPAYTSGGTVAGYFTLATPYLSADLMALVFVQSFDKMRITHPSYDPRSLTRTGHAAWTLTTITYAPGVPQVPAVASSTPGGTYFYQITAVDDASGEESLPSAAAGSSTQTATLSFTPVAGCTNYNVYKSDANKFGFIGRAVSSVATFTDTSIVPDASNSPPTLRQPFTGANNAPSCSTYWSQRSFYGNSNTGPQTVWSSVTGGFENMTVSEPTQNDDAITKTLNARSVNAIRNMVPLDDLLLFTSGGVWKGTINGSSDGVTPASLQFWQQTYSPVSTLPPVVAGDDVLFTHEKGATVYRMAFEALSTKWRPTNVSVLSAHFLEGGLSIVDWTYAEVPFNIIWSVRSDGRLLSFTYLKEQEVFAWSLHDVGGFVENVCSVSEGSEDAVYMIVRRTIDGNETRYVERLHSRSFTSLADGWFLDCGLRYSGAPATVIFALDHLEGETVTALADGVPVTGLVVTNGAVTIPTAASLVLVGMPFDSVMQTLGVETTPTVQGKPRRVSAATLALLNSRGGQCGPALDSMSNLPYLDNLGAPGTARELFTGDERVVIDPDWDTGGAVFIRQREPYPLSVLGDTLEVSLA